MSPGQADITYKFGPDWLLRSKGRKQGEVITFYSYKGGTGRSMALVNCAGLISQQMPSDAKPILLIDFDLEAPGLHRYLTPYLTPIEQWWDRPGTIELFEALRDAVAKELKLDVNNLELSNARLDDESTAKLVDAINLSDYLLSPSIRGLFLLKAGRADDSYDRRVAHFDWESLFRLAPSLFRCLAERLSREFSLTFVDSRTGISDTTGICTMLLPDTLVVVFTPNSQSLTGIEHLVIKALEYRETSSDLRELRVYPLPSRVDNQVEHFRQVWRMGAEQHPLFNNVSGYEPMFKSLFTNAMDMENSAEACLSAYFDMVQIPHSADYAYGERICFIPGMGESTGDSLSIRNSYEQFLPWLVTGAHPWQRPDEILLDQQAEQLLFEVGFDNRPSDQDINGWKTWLDRLEMFLNISPHPALSDTTRLPTERRANLSIAMSLALAYKGELQNSIIWLKRLSDSYTAETAPSLPIGAMVYLLQSWYTLTNEKGESDFSVLATPDRREWLEQIGQIIRIWSPPWSQYQNWLQTVADLAFRAHWGDMECHAREELTDLCRQALGDIHPDTLLNMTRLARCLRNQDDLLKAQEIENRALPASLLVLETHQESLSEMNELKEWALGHLSQVTKSVTVGVTIDEKSFTLQIGEYAAQPSIKAPDSDPVLLEIKEQTESNTEWQLVFLHRDKKKIITVKGFPIQLRNPYADELVISYRYSKPLSSYRSSNRTVLISYTHDNDAHQQRVFALADRLKNDGVDIILDRDCGPGGPDEGWDKWSEMQAEKTAIILPVFTPEYRKCWDGEQMPGIRRGTIHELKVIYRRLYNAGSHIDFCRILTFEDDHRNCIPVFLRGLPAFDAQRDYAQIIAWLRLKGVVPDPTHTPSELSWPKFPAEYHWPIADRIEQIRTFKDMISQQISQRILLIEGARNTGKTVLLYQFFKLAKTINICAVQLDLKGCPNLNDLFKLLALEVGRNILPAFHSANGSARRLALLKDLENLKVPLLIGFDTYQEIAPDIAEWLEGQFLRRIDQCPGLLVIIAGQKVPVPSKYPWDKQAIVHQLQPIRETKYWREYVERVLNTSQITDDHIEMLIHLYGGDPGVTSAFLESFAGKKNL